MIKYNKLDIVKVKRFRLNREPDPNEVFIVTHAKDILCRVACDYSGGNLHLIVPGGLDPMEPDAFPWSMSKEFVEEDVELVYSG